MKKYFTNFLKLALVLALFYYLAQKGAISLESTRRAFTRWDLLIPSYLALIFNGAIAAWRWQILLRTQNIVLPYRKTLELSFIGNFFNVALPGAVSGDFVKAFYVGKETPGQRGHTFGTILFDRVSGLTGLVFISAGAALFGSSHIPENALAGTRPLILTAAGCIFVFYAYLFLVREHHDPALRILRFFEKRVSKLQSLTHIYLGLRHYHHHRLTVVRVVAISMFLQMVVGWTCLQFVHALGEYDVHFLPLLLVFPLGLLVTAVPVAPAGVGTGHWAFAFLFGLIGSARGGDVFTLIALSNFAIGALGGLVYIRFKSHAPLPPQVTEAS